MRILSLILAMLLPVTSLADSALPFMKDLAGDAKLPRPWGVSIDFYTMDQDYDIKDLMFNLGDVSLGDPSLLKVTNDVEHYDLQADVWLLPFLNVFGLVGRVKTDTVVDFSQVEIVGLPFPLTTLPVSSKGTVWGLGFTLAYGTENWFTSVTTTFTDANLSGGFDSSIKSSSVQPRIGLIRSNWQFWGGGMYLKVDEKHSGFFELPPLGDVPFAVELETKNNWNYTVGARYLFGERANLSFEYGFGKRTHTLFNFNVRF